MGGAVFPPSYLPGAKLWWYIMTTSWERCPRLFLGLEEAQAGIKIAGKNINNLRYADDTTFMAESKEELKSLLMKMKEESKKLAQNSTFKKMKIMAAGPINSCQIDGETIETVTDCIWGGLQNHWRWWL